jgi:hypothetical protein
MKPAPGPANCVKRELAFAGKSRSGPTGLSDELFQGRRMNEARQDFLTTVASCLLVKASHELAGPGLT